MDCNKINQIIDCYNNGWTQKEIANYFNCCQSNISSILKKNNISTRVGKHIIYNDINKNFFKNINSEYSAYFLGFLFADGCVQIKNNAYSITLKLKNNDVIIIEKFRDIMSPSSPIKNIDNKYSCFRINQKEICEQLISLGCIPNKSLILNFPTAIPNELIRHFIRGYSDGDGTIYKNRFKNKKTINTIWKIISTKQFCNEVANILKQELEINCSQSLSRPNTNKITTAISVGGNKQVKKVLDWLYEGSSIYLPRKHDKYLEFLDYYSSSKS